MNSSSQDTRMFRDEEIIALTRSVESHDFDRITPPPQVWDNVLAEYEVEVASQEASARRGSTRWLSSSRLLSAAAVALLMVGVTVAVVTYRGNDSATNTDLASASLSDEGLPVATDEVAAAVFECEGETCFISVELSALPDAGVNDLELWVINADVTDMHSLGLVTDRNGRYQLPDGVTAEDFPIVDISIEPNDGDETHSGQSVLRGVLDRA